MTERSVIHAALVVERTYDVSPARAFAAWADKEAMMRWAVPTAGIEVDMEAFDFQVGGGWLTLFGEAGAPKTLTDEARFLDIVPDTRIVAASRMADGDTLWFAGVLTVEMEATTGKGCRLKLTEQGAYLDGHDAPENHQAGWNLILDTLGKELMRAEAA